MSSYEYTLDQVPGLILALSSDDKRAKELKSSLYKLPRYRSRKEPFNNISGERRFTTEWYKYSTGKLYSTQYIWGSATIVPDSVESCTDYVRNHSYNAKKYGDVKDTGSEFLKTRVYWHDANSVNVHVSARYSPVFWRVAYGHVNMSPPSFIHDGFNVTTSVTVPAMDYDISSYGPVAWNRYKPAKPTLDLAVFLGEARDLPRLLHARVSGIKSISDFWLAVQFGWKPLLHDIMDMINFVDKINKQVEFIYQNAGKPIRRHGPVAVMDRSEVVWNRDASDSTTTLYAGLSTTLNGRMYPSKPGASASNVTLLYKQSIMFSGAFRFWFNGKPPDYDTLAGKLAGLEVTPRVVWELLPWSWLFDWFANFDDMISNLVTEVADGQASEYAYITSKTTRSYKFSGTDGYLNAGITKTFESTCRAYCHPFGTGTNPTNLTNSQLSILIALGISRYKK